MPAALTSSPSEVAVLAAEFESASATEILRWAFEQFGQSAAIGTSFQGAGLVTIHHAVAEGCRCRSSRSIPDCFFPRPWN